MSIRLTLSDPLTVPEMVNNKTFQVHVKSPTEILLYLVEIDKDSARCPVIVGGERCGNKVGHEGKHQ
jgi:hypothetical protein